LFGKIEVEPRPDIARTVPTSNPGIANSSAGPTSTVELLELLLYTGGRREDAVRLGPQHLRDGRVRFVQAKNEHRTPVQGDIPLHPKLGAAIAATRSKHLTFLITEYGKPYTPAGFGNAIRD
jgi:hypothetical protein